MRNKTIIILSSLILLIFIVITLVLPGTEREILKNEHIIKSSINNKMLSIMMENGTDSGEYQTYKGSSWPSGYIFNETLSKCENGGVLSWNSKTNSVLLNTKKSDKCYAYFDKEPDFIISGGLAIIHGHFIIVTDLKYSSNYVIDKIYLTIKNVEYVTDSAGNINEVDWSQFSYGEQVEYEFYAVTNSGLKSNVVKGSAVVRSDGGAGGGN